MNKLDQAKHRNEMRTLDKVTLERTRAYQRDVLIPSKNNQSNIDPELQELGRMIDEHNDMFIEELKRSGLDE